MQWKEELRYWGIALGVSGFFLGALIGPLYIVAGEGKHAKRCDDLCKTLDPKIPTAGTLLGVPNSTGGCICYTSFGSIPPEAVRGEP